MVAGEHLTFNLPVLSPDGKTVELWRAFVDGTPAAKLNTMVDGNIGSVRLHPDGRQLAFEVNTPQLPAEIWATENFLMAPKAAK